MEFASLRPFLFLIFFFEYVNSGEFEGRALGNHLAPQAKARGLQRAEPEPEPEPQRGNEESSSRGGSGKSSSAPKGPSPSPRPSTEASSSPPSPSPRPSTKSSSSPKQPSPSPRPSTKSSSSPPSPSPRPSTKSSSSPKTPSPSPRPSTKIRSSPPSPNTPPSPSPRKPLPPPTLTSRPRTSESSPSPAYRTGTLSSSSQFAKERSKPIDVQGELKLSTPNAANLAADDSLRGAFSTAIGRVSGVKADSVTITHMTRFRRLTDFSVLSQSARRLQQRLSVGFRIATANQYEADSAVAALEGVSRTMWKAELDSEMIRQGKSTGGVDVLEVTAAVSIGRETDASANEDGSNTLLFVLLGVALFAVTGVVVVLVLLWKTCYRTPASKRARVANCPQEVAVAVVVESPPVSLQTKPWVAMDSKPDNVRSAWSDVSTEVSSNLSQSGISFYSVASDSCNSVRTPQRQQFTSATSGQERLRQQAVVVQSSPRGTARTGQTVQPSGSTRVAHSNMNRQTDVVSNSRSLSTQGRMPNSNAQAFQQRLQPELPQSTQRSVSQGPRQTTSSKSQPFQQSAQRGSAVRSVSGPPSNRRAASTSNHPRVVGK